MPLPMFKPSSPEARITEMLRVLQQGPADGQGGGMRSPAPPPAGVRMLDWLFAPEAERARMASGSPLDRMLPPGMTSFGHLFDPTAKLHRPAAGRPETNGARGVWDERSRSMLFAPNVEDAPDGKLSQRFANTAISGLPPFPYGAGGRLGAAQNSPGRREMPTSNTPQREADPGQAPSPQPEAGPPTMDPVELGETDHRLDFDPQGQNQYQRAARHPLAAWKGWGLRGESFSAVARLRRSGQLPLDHPHNNEADAFRHAYWSYRMAQELGPDLAKAFTDAHEISEPNDHGECLMDLHNNEVGRRLAMDPKNRGRPAEEVIMEDFRNNRLQISPFTVIDGSGGH